jgi:hypothetical protein
LKGSEFLDFRFRQIITVKSIKTQHSQASCQSSKVHICYEAGGHGVGLKAIY